jgi:hypothetical protein
VGDVVLFLSLMAQLYGPLAWFGGYYRECLTLACSRLNPESLLAHSPARSAATCSCLCC